MTKFSVPRTRRDSLRREPLLTRLRQLATEHAVSLVCAPAGSGKTTLMAQLAASLQPGERPVWVALDEQDNDPARLLATLVQSLQPLELDWERDPQALVANVAGGGSEARAALAGIVNALCTDTEGRILWLLDDLQRVDDPATLKVLEALIERLPGHVSLILGARSEPALPLARLRAQGELGELDASQLRFDATDVMALGERRWGDAPSAAVVRDMLERTRGWAVGVQLMLASRSPMDTVEGPQAGAASRELLEFLAQEVLDELPPELRRFAVDCAVLPELSPTRCRAVTLRADSAELLDELLRRHLFLSVVDEQEPLLKFHDLFRDFLLQQLSRQPASHQVELHERAAAAEPLPERAIAHWLQARCWPQAIALIVQHGLRMAAEGAYSTIERWIESLPPDLVHAEPHLALLRAECAWSRWNWEGVLQHAATAVDGLALSGDLSGRLRAQLLLCAALGALGHLQERAELTEESFAFDLSTSDAAQFSLQRAWSAFSLGHTDDVGRHLATVNALVAEDPPRHAPQIAQTFNCHFGGLPGVTEAYQRFAALCESVAKPAAMPWHCTPVVLGAWASLWRGDRHAAVQALEQGDQLQRRFGTVRYVALDAIHLQALLHAAQRDYDAAARLLQGLLADLDASDAGGLRQAWQRAYRCVLSRTLWMAQDREALSMQARLLEGTARPREWPLVASAVDTVRGQAALLEGRLDDALACLEAAVEGHRRYPAPAFHADPRIALALVKLQGGDGTGAWRTLAPVLHEIVRDGTPGRLVLEPAPGVARLLDLCPADAPEAAAIGPLRQALSTWWPAAGEASSAPARSVPEDALNPVASRLSDREREVLDLVARGLPNKVLARQLAISAHTVKRHLANILDKLDCDNRGQAADLWRRGGFDR